MRLIMKHISKKKGRKGLKQPIQKGKIPLTASRSKHQASCAAVKRNASEYSPKRCVETSAKGNHRNKTKETHAGCN